MAKWVCSVCGYVHEGDTAPEVCPICKAPAEKFTKQDDEMAWAAEHVVGVAKGVSEDILADLRANFEGECSEVGMYLAMARVAHREGYPEVGMYYEKAAYEEAEHVVGVAKGVSEDILEDLRANFNGECSEVGMYLAMARVAHREGYPEIGLYWEKAAYEEAEHAAKFAELLGEVVTDSTKKNLELRVAAEHGATEGKFDLAKRAKAANLDAIHDTVHEMAKDEARHGKAFEGLLKRYFG